MCQQVFTRLLAGILALSLSLDAKTWHVSPDGQPPAGSSGTFSTLVSAASGVVAGDTVWVHAGTYRATLKPLHSGTPAAPIVFLAPPGERPVLTGLDSLGGWTLGSKGIWTTPVADSVTQLFQNRSPMPEARFPNTGRDLFHPATIPLNLTGLNATSSSLTAVDPTWAGATLWALINLRWISQTGVVASASPGELALSSVSSGGQDGAGIGYVAGVLPALDTAGEWLWKADTLHFIPDSGKTPVQVLIEGKTRAWAIDLSLRTDIVVKGLGVFAGGANLNRSRRCRLEGLSMRYLTHFASPVVGNYTSSWTRWKGIDINAPGIGIGIFGDSNTVAGSDIQWSAGDGITIYGNGNLVENNTVSKADYAGPDMNGISIYGNGNRVTRNTVDSCGRGGIFLFGGGTERIDHNLVYNVGMVDWDVGGIYMYGVDGQGTNIDHNWVHDSHSADQYRLGMGIYIDNFNANTSVHHNVVWNCDNNALNYSRPAVNITWANNTVFNATNVTSSYLHPDATVDSSKNNRLWNNLMTTSYASGGTFGALDQSHNVKASTLPLRDPPHFDFRPLPGSAAIDAGVSIPGLDDAIVGSAPDAGAYEAGGVFWKAGAGSVDSGLTTNLVTREVVRRAAWTVAGTRVLARASCDLEVTDLVGRSLARRHLEAGQSLDLAGRGHGLVLVGEGGVFAAVFLDR